MAPRGRALARPTGFLVGRCDPEIRVGLETVASAIVISATDATQGLVSSLGIASHFGPRDQTGGGQIVDTLAVPRDRRQKNIRG